MDRHRKTISTLMEDVDKRRLSRREFIRTVTLLGIAAPTAYSLMGVVDPFVDDASAQTPKAGGLVRVGTRIHSIIDAHRNDVAEASNVVRQVCEYLTRTDVDNVTRPYLLRSWEASEDLKTWTLNLRNDVFWRKRRKFTADDVIWNIERVMETKTGSVMLGLMQSYLGGKDGGLWDANALEKVDDYTVRLNLKSPQLAVPENFFNFPMAIVDPEENGAFAPGVNGTGPFNLVEYEPQSRAVYEPNKDYWGEGPYLDALQFIDLGNEPSSWIGALRSGQVDGLHSFDAKSHPAFEKLDDVKIYNVTTAETAVIQGRVDQKPFNDARVRKALRKAIDANAVLAVALGGRGTVAEHHHVSPIHPECAKIEPFKPDLQEAKRLLEEAGYAEGFAAELVVRQEPEWLMPAALNMVNQWAQIGVRISIKPMAPSLHNDVWNKVPFGMMPWRHRPLGTMILSLAYRSGSSWNGSVFNSPRFDELLTQAEGTVETEKRALIMAEIETLMQEEGPIVQPLWQESYTAYRSIVNGFALHPTGFIFAERFHLS